MRGKCDEVEWDEFVATHPLGHHEQCTMYGYLRTFYGFEFERITLRDESRIVAGAQILLRDTPFGRLATIKRGPLAVDDDPAHLQQLLQRIDAFVRARRICTLRVETFSPQEVVRAVLLRNGFKPSESWGGRRATVVMPLDGSDDELLARMTQKGRYNTRRAERFGVEVRVGDAESIGEFHTLHSMTASHQKFPVFDCDYYHYAWELFGEQGRMQHFLAYHDDRPIAAICNTIVGDLMLYGWGGIDRNERKQRLMASYLLHFRAMCWARDHGCRLYDMSGVSESKTSGLTQFKTRLAPRRTHWPATMVKYYGPFRAMRSAVEEHAWSIPFLRQSVRRVARRLGLNPQMPW